MKGEGSRTGVDPDRPEPGPDGDESAFDAALRSFVHDSSLWPALVVGVLILATLVCAVLVLAVVDRNPAAMAASGGLLFLSYHACRFELRSRRPGPRTGILLAIWALAAAALLVLGAGTGAVLKY